MTEKTLKDKIVKVYLHGIEGEQTILKPEDVAEAVAKLKEELEDTHGSSWIVQKVIIDKIFGDFK